MIDPIAGSGGAAAAATATAKGATQGASAPPSISSTAAEDATGGAAAAPASVTRVYVDRSDSGVYVYRLIDVDTGQILVELPRAASQTLKVANGYAPGAMASRSV